MGIMFGVSLFAGILAGIVVSAFLLAASLTLTRNEARRNPRAWRIFLLVLLVSLPLFVAVVYLFPLATGKPGSNYTLLFKFYFLLGLAYSAIPGVSAALSCAAAVMSTGLPPASGSSNPKRRKLMIVCLLLPAVLLICALWLFGKDTGKDGMAGACPLLSGNASLPGQDDFHSTLGRYSEQIESGKLDKPALAAIYEKRAWIYKGDIPKARECLARCLQLGLRDSNEARMAEKLLEQGTE